MHSDGYLLLIARPLPSFLTHGSRGNPLLGPPFRAAGGKQKSSTNFATLFAGTVRTSHTVPPDRAMTTIHLELHLKRAPKTW